MIMTTQGTFLPYDLQDQIIGHLRDDSKSLAACSLVSSLWSELARMLLFSRSEAQIAYRTSEEEERVTELIALLEAPNSRLGQYIHHVSIDGSDDFFVIVDARAYQPRYDMVFSALRRIVPRLPRIDTLKIRALTWCCVSRDAQIQIGNLSEVKSLSWSRIHVDRVDDFFQFSIKNFPKLEEYQVSELGAKEVPAFGPTMFFPYTNRFMSLRKLVILIEESTVPLVLALTNNIISVQNIDTLDIKLYKMAFFGHVDSLLKAIGPTLTALTIRLYFYDSTFEKSLNFPMHLAPFSLSTNVSLRRLYLVSDCSLSNLRYWKPILLSNTDIRELIEIRLKFSYLGSSEESYLNTHLNFSVLEDALMVQRPHSVRVVLKCYTIDTPRLSKAIIRSTRELAKHVQLSVVFKC